MTRVLPADGPEISVVLPVYNEEDNLIPLHSALREALAGLGKDYEILFIDDGSRDRSPTILEDLVHQDPRVRAIFFGTNFGQTAALSAGIDHARGRVLITLDADLQNDPKDIPALLAKLAEGYDVVSGWRKDRKDNAWVRILPSRIANGLISWASGVHLNDYGCTLKAYRREIFDSFHLYGEMHRFIPAYAHMHGARVGELAVAHHPRIHGTSKYGLSRTFKVILDLLTYLFLKGYSTKPIHVFGGLALVSGAAGALTAAFVVFRRMFMGGEWLSPLLFISLFLAAQAIQFFMMGLVAEMIVRTYHESQGKTTYVVRRVVEAPRAGERTEGAA